MPQDALSISQAARAYGVNRSTIQRKIKSGDLKKASRSKDAGVTLDSLRAHFGHAPLDVNTTSPEGAARVPHAAGDAAPVQHAAPLPHAAGAAELLATLKEAHAREIAAKDAHIQSLERQVERADTEKGELRDALKLEQQKTARMLLMLDAPKDAPPAHAFDGEAVPADPAEPAGQKKPRRAAGRVRRVKVEIMPRRSPPLPQTTTAKKKPSAASGFLNWLRQFKKGGAR